MSPPITLDTTDDFDPAFTSKANQKRNLLLSPPSVAANENKLRDLFTTYDRSSTDLQMLDRISAGLVTLPPATYDFVLVLTDDDGARRAEAYQLLSRDVYAMLVTSMKSGSKLQLESGSPGPDEVREAILAGLVEKDGVFEKPIYEEASIPLRFGAKNKNKNKKEPVVQNGFNATSFNLAEPDDEDELIDEDDLLTEEDLKRDPQIPVECQPKSGKKRRRACKDCSCGLASRLEAEDKSRREKADKDLNTFKLDPDNLDDAVDFTVKGKVGSCGSCSLGDAFRCDGCPYIGLPPFKPGEEVRLVNDTVQL